MTIFVTWQIIVTLDSIRNSCDVCIWSASCCHEVPEKQERGSSFWDSPGNHPLWRIQEDTKSWLAVFLSTDRSSCSYSRAKTWDYLGNHYNLTHPVHIINSWNKCLNYLNDVSFQDTEKVKDKCQRTLADCPAMSFVFVCWHINIIISEIQISWVGRSTRRTPTSTDKCPFWHFFKNIVLTIIPHICHFFYTSRF